MVMAKLPTVIFDLGNGMQQTKGDHSSKTGSASKAHPHQSSYPTGCIITNE